MLQVIFTSPELTAVGLTQDEENDGRACTVVDRAQSVIVGMTPVGPVVGELIYTVTMAIVGAVLISRLWHAVPAYPTISEIWLRLLGTFEL